MNKALVLLDPNLKTLCPAKSKSPQKPLKKYRNSNHKQGKKITAMQSIREVKFQSGDHFPTITGDRE